MQTNFFSKFKHVLSDERLSAYQQRLARDGNRNLFSHHARQQFRRRSEEHTSELQSH